MTSVESDIKLDEAKKVVKEASYTGMVAAAEDELERIDKGFDRGQDALGRPWQPLAPSTIRRKGSSDILIETGAMRKSFYVEEEPQNRRVFLGGTDWKIPYHEYGTQSIPRRPMLMPAFIDLKETRLKKHVSREIKDALRGTNFRVTISQTE